MLDIEVVAQPAQAEDRPPVPGFADWWDASDAGTIQGVVGNEITRWGNKAAPGRFFNQGNAAWRPYSGSWSQNGRNVVWSHTKSSFMQTSGLGITGQPWTSFVVAGHSKGATQQTAWTAWDGFGGEFGRNYRAGAPGAIAIYGAGGFSSSQNWELGRPRVVSSIFDGASSVLRVDGRYANTGSVPGGSGATGYTALGYSNSEHWNGWIGELLIYPRRLTAGELQLNESYLTRKWGVQ